MHGAQNACRHVLTSATSAGGMISRQMAHAPSSTGSDVVVVVVVVVVASDARSVASCAARRARRRGWGGRQGRDRRRRDASEYSRGEEGDDADGRRGGTRASSRRAFAAEARADAPRPRPSASRRSSRFASRAPAARGGDPSLGGDVGVASLYPRAMSSSRAATARNEHVAEGGRDRSTRRDRGRARIARAGGVARGGNAEDARRERARPPSRCVRPRGAV